MSGIKKEKQKEVTGLEGNADLGTGEALWGLCGSPRVNRESCFIQSKVGVKT